MAVSKKVKLGDILEIQTPAGFAYVQYTHEDPDMGSLVRVLPTLHQDRPAGFSKVASEREAYFIFYAMRHAIRRGQTRIVSHQPIPEWAKPWPMMRSSNGEDASGKVRSWKIMRADTQFTLEELKRIPNIMELTPEQTRLSIHSLWTHDHLAKRLAEGWTPERAEVLRLKQKAQSEMDPLSSNGAESSVGDQELRYFLYFPRQEDARRVGHSLEGKGFSVQVRKGAAGTNWLVLAASTPPESEEKIDETREELEELAARYNGEYDGWELGPGGARLARGG